MSRYYDIAVPIALYNSYIVADVVAPIVQSPILNVRIIPMNFRTNKSYSLFNPTGFAIPNNKLFNCNLHTTNAYYLGLKSYPNNWVARLPACRTEAKLYYLLTTLSCYPKFKQKLM